MAHKTAIVTGGASGIGYAMARYLANHGDYEHVAILDVVDVPTGCALAAELSAAPEAKAPQVRFVPCDVSSWAAQAAAFAEVKAQCGGRIDVVMANAGISGSNTSILGEEGAEPQEPSLRALDVNLRGVIYSVNLAVHYFRMNEVLSTNPCRGSIICTASNAGLYPFPAAPLYAASKSGVVGLVRSLRAPLDKLQIQINALAPAVLETNIAALPLFKDMIITPMSTLVRGVDQLLSSPAISGGVAEIHGQHVTLRGPHEYADADTKKNIEMFWTLGHA